MKLLESDIHFGKSNNSQIKNQDCLDFIKFTCDFVKEHKEVDEIIFLGDWFDNRDSINVSTLYYSSKALELLNSLDIPVKFLVGNHDLFLKNSRDITSLLVAKEYKNIEVIDSPKFDGKDLYVPWLVGEEKLPLLIQQYNPRYVYGHFEIPSFKFNQQVVYEGIFNPNEYKCANLKRIFSGHFHCLTEDHEVLTDSGWKKWFEIKPEDKVMTYNIEKEICEFNEIKYLLVKDIDEEVYHYKTLNMDCICTKEHRIFGKYEGKYMFTTPSSGYLPKKFKFILGANLEEKQGINVSDDFIRLLVWITTDGCFEYKTREDGSLLFDSIRFHIKKERKIKELLELLNRMKINFSYYEYEAGRKRIRISKSEVNRFNLLDYFDFQDKKLPIQVKLFNKHQVDILLETYSYTDGNKSSLNSIQIGTSKKYEADLLQEILVCNGYRCTQSCIKLSEKNPNHNNRYTLSVCNLPTSTFPFLKQTKEHYKGKVFCLTVDNSTFLARRNGKPFFTGNCKNSHDNIQYIGNTHCLDMSDVNDENNKGITLLNVDTDETSQVAWKEGPTYRKINISQLENHEDEYLKDLHKIYLNIVLDINFNDKKEEYREQLKEKYDIRNIGYQAQWFEDATQEVEDIEVKDFSNIETLVVQYIKQIDTESIRVDRLIELFNMV